MKKIIVFFMLVGCFFVSPTYVHANDTVNSSINPQIAAEKKASHHDADVLWKIVHGQCAVNADHHPCQFYDGNHSFALLKSKVGQAHYLLIPTQKITGLEDDALINPKTPNFLKLAWENRSYVHQAYQRDIADERLSLTINAEQARSQNQLHIHIDCLRQDVMDDLDKYPYPKSETQLKLGGNSYRAFPLNALAPSPFLLFSNLTEKERGNHALAILYRGKNKFLLLEEVVNKNDLYHGWIESLQDHQCAMSKSNKDKVK